MIPRIDTQGLGTLVVHIHQAIHQVPIQIDQPGGVGITACAERLEPSDHPSYAVDTWTESREPIR